MQAPIQPTPGAPALPPLELHPLRQPPTPDWWPPAPGWWLLAALLVILLVLAVRHALRRYRLGRYRRRALQEFQQLSEQYPAEQAASSLVRECNALLKRVALHIRPRQEVAALSGERWVAFLNSALEVPVFQPEHAPLPYSAQVSPAAARAFADASGHWLRQHRPDRVGGSSEAAHV